MSAALVDRWSARVAPSGENSRRTPTDRTDESPSTPLLAPLSGGLQSVSDPVAANLERLVGFLSRGPRTRSEVERELGLDSIGAYRLLALGLDRRVIATDPVTLTYFCG